MAGAGSLWARYLAATLAIILTALAFVVASGMNYTYGLSKGSSDPLWFGVWTNTKQLSGLAFLSIDGLAAIAALILIWNVRAKSVAGAFIALAFCVLCGVGSCLATMGFMAMERANATAGLSQQHSTREEWQDTLDRLKARGEWADKAMRPAGTIAAEITDAEGNELYARSKSCTEATLDDSKKHCAKYRALKTELAAAGDAARTDEQIEEAKAKLREIKKVVVEDGLAGLLHDLFGINENSTNRYHPVLLALIIYFAATFGLPLAESAVASGRVQAPSDRAWGITVVRPTAPSFELPVPIGPAPDDATAPEPKPAPPIEQPKETAAGQPLDVPGRALVPVGSSAPTAEDWVARWAWGLPAGAYTIEDLKESYGKFVSKKKAPKIHMGKLSAALVQLGYEKFRDPGNDKKVSFRFPLNARIVSSATSARA